MIRRALLFCSLAVALNCASPVSAQSGSISLSGSTQTLLDAMYDYSVYAAPSTEGEYEYLIWAYFPDRNTWDYVHHYEFVGTADHGSMQDSGIATFESWYRARLKARNLVDSGEITSYYIDQRQVPPDWSFEATFSTRAEAEEYAELLEEFSIRFGDPHVTKIVQVSQPIVYRTTSR